MTAPIDGLSGVNSITPRRRGEGEAVRASTEPAVPAIGARGQREPDRAELTGRAARSGPAQESSGGVDRESDGLTEDERKQVETLRARDLEVKTHEQAHVAAAGELFRGGPYYDYRTGPDGQRYAVSGRVNIDTSPGRTPEESIAKAAKIKRSALAPAEPSSTDRAVAAEADRLASKARAELAEQTRAKAEGGSARGGAEGGAGREANRETDSQAGGVGDRPSDPRAASTREAGRATASRGTGAYRAAGEGSRAAARTGSLIDALA